MIILTTTENPQVINRCYRLGCNACLCKPVSFESFAQVLGGLGHFIQSLKSPQNLNS
ncbi:MAG: hypothetical protein P4L99_27460 [Chthoniobacter sp.]|nr:hypothetical protein [Chthoniobacter sp.]